MPSHAKANTPKRKPSKLKAAKRRVKKSVVKKRK